MRVWLQVAVLVLLIAGSSLVLFGDVWLSVQVLILMVAAILRTRPSLDWAIGLIVLGILVALLLLLPLQAAREAARRVSCSNNLKQIGLALHNYADVYHCFPPPYIPDKNGKPMHSWRVLILPFLNYSPVFDVYDLNEPWDGPHNRELLACRPPEFVCPGDKDAAAEGVTTTSYLAVVGKDAMWQPGKPTSAAELSSRRGDDHTVMVVEVPNSGINWTEPRDFSLDELTSDRNGSSAVRASIRHISSSGFFWRHTVARDAHVLLADGSVGSLPAAAVLSGKLHHWLSVGGYNAGEVDQEAAKSDAPDRIPGSDEIVINWMNCIALAVWSVSVGLLFYRAWRSGTEANQMPPGSR